MSPRHFRQSRTGFRGGHWEMGMKEGGTERTGERTTRYAQYVNDRQAAIAPFSSNHSLPVSTVVDRVPPSPTDYQCKDFVHGCPSAGQFDRSGDSPLLLGLSRPGCQLLVTQVHLLDSRAPANRWSLRWNLVIRNQRRAPASQVRPRRVSHIRLGHD